MTDYGRRLVLDSDFDDALADTINALQIEGVDVITRFDAAQHVRERLHHECRRYVLLQVASPQLLLAALQTDVEAGSLVPVTVAVFELADGESAVEVCEPFAPIVSDPAWRRDAPDLAAIADRESEQIARALARLQRGASRPGSDRR